MISIIVCATDKEAVLALEKNVQATVECPYEMLCFDNTTQGWGLCKVYNHMARQAKYEVLCFVHQDVKFHDAGWGKELCTKALEPKTGVVGVAGSTYKSQTQSGWVSLKEFSHMHLYEKGINHHAGLENGDYQRVITLDGVLLCTSAHRWRQIPFDEQTLQGFHCYDVDFSVAMASAGYNNFVSKNIGLEHFSSGKFGEQWWAECVKLHDKWHDKLPIFVDMAPNGRQVAKIEKQVYRRTTYLLLKNKIGSRTFAKQRLVRTMKDNPLNINNLELLVQFF